MLGGDEKSAGSTARPSLSPLTLPSALQSISQDQGQRAQAERQENSAEHREALSYWEGAGTSWEVVESPSLGTKTAPRHRSG